MAKKKTIEEKRTLAELDGKVGYLDRDGIGYRKTRATAVLATASHYIQSKQDVKLVKVLKALRKNNFDLNRLGDNDLELLYARFDEDMTHHVTSEFRFIPRIGNIRDLGDTIGHCELCGKGDSRDDGANEDKLRYEFKLTNESGGDDVWVGSTCILQHGLHVDGAANAGQAKDILKKTFQDHLKMWQIEAWQTANPDHESIPELWENFRAIYFASYPSEFYEVFGSPAWRFVRTHRRMFKPFRRASLFYERKGFLTDTISKRTETSKTDDWREAAKMYKEIQGLFKMFREALNKHPRDPHARLEGQYAEAIAWLEKKKDGLDKKKQIPAIVIATNAAKGKRVQRPKRVRRAS